MARTTSGPAISPGYAVVNLGGRYALTRWLQMVGQINNLFDRRYYTAAQLGALGFTDSETLHRAAAPADRWRVSGEALDVLRAGRADPGMDRHAIHVLKRRSA